MYVLIEVYADGLDWVVEGNAIAVSNNPANLVDLAAYEIIDELPEDALQGWIRCYIREIDVV